MSTLQQTIPATSARGPMHAGRFSLFINIAGALALLGTSSERTPEEGERLKAGEQTNSGAKAPESLSTGSAVLELRMLTGLTWDQLARMFGVGRRSLHFWASGERLSKANEERLGKILALVRLIDRGSPSLNRSALLGASGGGVIPFDLLVEERFDEVLQALGTTARVTRPSPKPLSRQARMARAPQRPRDLVEANQEIGHKRTGKARRPRVARAKKRDD